MRLLDIISGKLQPQKPQPQGVSCVCEEITSVNTNIYNSSKLTSYEVAVIAVDEKEAVSTEHTSCGSAVIAVIAVEPTDSHTSLVKSSPIQSALPVWAEPLKQTSQPAPIARALFRSGTVCGLGAAPDTLCWCCRGTDFWVSQYRPKICRRCHPPAPGAEVVQSSKTAKTTAKVKVQTQPSECAAITTTLNSCIH